MSPPPNERQRKTRVAISPARVKAARVARGLTQEELMTRMGVSLSLVSKRETGRSPVYKHQWFSICAALGLPLDWQIGDEVPPETDD